MSQVLFALRVIALLTLGPVVIAGSFWALQLKGGILNCPFPLPFIMCQFCPVFCDFGVSRTGLFYGILRANFLMGRAFCGFFCPGGTAQDFLYKLPLRKLSLSLTVDRWLKQLKYFIAFVIILLVVEAVGIWQGIPLISSLWFWLLGHPSQVKNTLIILIAFSLLVAIFLSRNWCRYLCPLGAWISPFNKYSLITLERDASRCLQCHQCSRNCSGSIQVASDSWDSAECLRCLECYIGCKARVLGFKLRGQKR